MNLPNNFWIVNLTMQKMDMKAMLMGISLIATNNS